MKEIIQIAPLKTNFQRIIDFDRLYPSAKIVVFVAKCDTEKDSKNYSFIEKSLGKLREYCQLAQIQFSMKVIDYENKTDLMDVIFDLVRALILDYEEDCNYYLNLGDNSLLMNVALIQATQLLKSTLNSDAFVFIKEELKDQEITFEQNIPSSYEALVTNPVSLDLLTSIDDGKTLEQIKEVLQISLGSISNYMKHLKELGLITINGHTRSLTNLGRIIRQILLLIEEV